ncbi:MAG: hypothetical protein K0V04_02125, partial [Deltaproteobacteria bacterium]|nr:hypothetical protein [Deltaproteobacteria bacterium]
MRRPYSSFAVPALVLGTLAVVDVPAHAAAGGPDAAGYTFVDEVDGATFNYVDITLTGTLLVDADDGTASIALGAPFTFYGIVYLGMGVSTNGFISDDLTLASDFSNDCPLPDPPSLGAGSFRMAALHDDLVTQVFYQYFDAAQAAAVGYPGEADGISVFQWVGGHFGGQQSAVDAELVLRHADNSIVSMVAQDSDAGSGSTMGIQNMDGSIGLTYGCNQPGYVVPGTTAVEYTPGVLPDSDCCNPSGTATPGCTNVACQVTVCAADASCCDTAWTQACADAAALDCGFLCGGPLPNINLNEIRINDLGPDNNEYFEIVGVPGTSLDDVQYIVIGDFPTGEIEAVVDLSGNVVPPSAFFSVGEASLTLGVPDLVAPLNFENNDTVTHMLVGGFSGAVGNNVDPNADGVFDTTPWLVIFDALSIVEPGGEELPYATAANCGGGGECQEVGGNTTPSHVYRCPNIS